MLIECYPLKPKVAALPFVAGDPDYKYREYARKHKLTIEEVKRRDTIIREKYANCKYIRGHIVYPSSEADLHKYGAITIHGVCKNIFEFGDDVEWSKSDNPMIVTGQPEKTNYVIFCTTNYFREPGAKNNGGTC